MHSISDFRAMTPKDQVAAVHALEDEELYSLARVLAGLSGLDYARLNRTVMYRLAQRLSAVQGLEVVP